MCLFHSEPCIKSAGASASADLRMPLGKQPALWNASDQAPGWPSVLCDLRAVSFLPEPWSFHLQRLPFPSVSNRLSGKLQLSMTARAVFWGGTGMVRGNGSYCKKQPSHRRQMKHALEASSVPVRGHHCPPKVHRPLERQDESRVGC